LSSCMGTSLKERFAVVKKVLDIVRCGVGSYWVWRGDWELLRVGNLESRKGAGEGGR
jgi:hypothetical protein